MLTDWIPMDVVEAPGPPGREVLQVPQTQVDTTSSSNRASNWSRQRLFDSH